MKLRRSLAPSRVVAICLAAPAGLIAAAAWGPAFDPLAWALGGLLLAFVGLAACVVGRLGGAIIAVARGRATPAQRARLGGPRRRRRRARRPTTPPGAPAANPWARWLGKA